MNEEKSFPKTSINWYPGHMAKTKRQIKENMKLIDIVYEIVDARIPYSSKIKDIDEIIKEKINIIIMTKKDLCDLKRTNKWIKYYESKGYTVICLDLKNNNDYKRLVEITREKTKDIQEKRKQKGLKPKEIKALVIGSPNVGKSTLINKMLGRKAAAVANKPGVTKNLNFLPTNFGITLLDTPGILWPKLDEEKVALNLACVGSIKKEVLNLFDVVSYLLKVYIDNYPQILSETYNIKENDIMEIYSILSSRWGFTTNGEIDYNKTSERLYNDFINGKILNITLDIYGE